MLAIFLLLHILVGLASIATAVIGLASKGRMQKWSAALFAPSVVAVSLSGIGLVIFGGSLTRACMSGGLVLAAMYILRYFSAKRQTLSADRSA